MIAIKKVLVATDFGESAAAALLYGREMARTFGAELHLIHVIDDFTWRYSMEPSPALADIQGALEDAARRRVREVLTDNDREQLRAHSHIEIDASPAEAITDYARQAEVDLIIVGTHGRSGLPRLFLGSVAERIVRLAPCPVLTVRSHERDFVVPDVPSSSEMTGSSLADM